MKSALAAMALVVALLPGWAVAHRDGSACSGAAALPNHCPSPETVKYVPTADKADADHDGDGISEDCWTPLQFTPPYHTCTFGRAHAKYTVALVGNSHSAQWLMPLRRWADQYDLRIVTYLIPKCFAIDEEVEISHDQKQNKGCYAWGQWAQRETNKLKPDLIVTSERTYKKPIKDEGDGVYATWKAGYERYLKGWTSQGRHVLVIRDNPVPGKAVPPCLAAHPHQLSACAGDRKKWLKPDSLVAAARALDSRLVKTVDLSDHMCTDTKCPGVIGGICVYRDHSHMTATWIRSLQTFLESRFVESLHHTG
jgi:hypothetical protein